MRRFYQFFPTILRIRDQLASGFVQGNPTRPVEAVGDDGDFKGHSVLWDFLEAGFELDLYTQYYLRTSINDDTPRRDKLFVTPLQREVEFDYSPEGDPPYHFRVEVYSDRRMRVSDLVTTADSSSSTLGWYIKQQAVLERIMVALDEEGLQTELLIDDFADLTDADQATEPIRILMSVFLGSLLDTAKTEAFQRFFVRNLVSLHKIKGTSFSWKKQQQFTLGTVTPHVELFKTTPNERCDYSFEKDAAHQLKSARFAFIGPCASACETGAEVPELPRSQVRDVLDAIEDVRPAHVILRVPCKTKVLSDEWPTTSESLLPLEVIGSPLDTFPVLEESLLIKRSCVSTAQVGCLSCCETSCTSCEAFSCEADACQVGVQACNASCQFSCMVGITVEEPETGCDLRTESGGCITALEGGGGGCGGLSPKGGVKCQTPMQMKHPPFECKVGEQKPKPPFDFIRCTFSITGYNPDPGPYVMIRRIVNDPEFGQVTRHEMAPIEVIWYEMSQKGLTPVRAEDGGAILEGSYAQAGQSHGLILTHTGEPCNSCPSTSTGSTIPTGASVYPQQPPPPACMTFIEMGGP